MDDVTELRVLAFERKDDAVLEQLRDAADPLLEVLADDVGLLKLVVGIVDDDGNAVHQLVAERTC